LKPVAGPGNTTELLGIRPLGTISVATDGRTILRSGRTIAQIDATAKGSESALLVILAADITGNELLDLIKALSYRDSSRRLPVDSMTAAATRALYVGFVQKNASTVVADSTISMHRFGIENPSEFKDGTSRTMLTVSNLPLLGSSVMEDIDTAEVPSLSVTTISGGVASVIIQRGAEDTGDTYRTTIGWRHHPAV